MSCSSSPQLWELYKCLLLKVPVVLCYSRQDWLRCRYTAPKVTLCAFRGCRWHFSCSRRVWQLWACSSAGSWDTFLKAFCIINGPSVIQRANIDEAYHVEVRIKKAFHHNAKFPSLMTSLAFHRNPTKWSPMHHLTLQENTPQGICKSAFINSCILAFSFLDHKLAYTFYSPNNRCSLLFTKP